MRGRRACCAAASPLCSSRMAALYARHRFNSCDMRCSLWRAFCTCACSIDAVLSVDAAPSASIDAALSSARLLS